MMALWLFTFSMIGIWISCVKMMILAIIKEDFIDA